jgi:hypothetical protein
MQKRTWKRIALSISGVFVLGVIVLVVHIYVVTRPRVDASTRIMARIDIKQDIDQADADKITAWLYRQKGVDHVLVNPQSDIAIFSFAPVQNNANGIVAAFKREMPYAAQRNIPTAGEMNRGCPVAKTSVSYKVYAFIKNIF